MNARPIAVLTLFASAALFSLSQMPVSPERVVEYHRTPGSLFEPHTTVLFGGDMMFDRYIRQTMDNYGGNFIFSCIADVLSSADLVVANLEGPITEYTSVSARSEIGSPENFIFTFPPESAELLARHNIRLVNLGNNHILNFGWEGERSTRTALRVARISYFGSPAEQFIAMENLNGVLFAFINYNEFLPTSVRRSIYGTTDDSIYGTLEDIQRVRAAGYLPIIYIHWSDEYVTTSSAYSHELAHSFIDAGAEMVIGSHPHVIQESEVYRGKHIYYSLGNFVFDQYWDDDVRTGLLLRVTFTPRGVERIDEMRVYLERDGRTCLVE